ncbi:MAG: hypothetical protein NTY90_05525 [Candidatus Micrarchaeota archaeon]|nr:hypothetical protein [Candidatus Micrarchaeota archaeon]
MRKESVFAIAAVAAASVAIGLSAVSASALDSEAVELGSGVVAGAAIVFVTVFAVAEWARLKALEKHRGPVPDERELYVERHFGGALAQHRKRKAGRRGRKN